MFEWKLKFSCITIFVSGELTDEQERQLEQGEVGSAPPSQEPDLAIHVRQGTTISAPTSPSKNVPAFSQRANSVAAGSSAKVPSAKDKYKTLLVIDDHQTDWWVNFALSEVMQNLWYYFECKSVLYQ